MQCAACKKPATLVCSGCKDCNDLDPTADVTRYCGAECQKADWKNHKRACRRLKDRTQLYRVAMFAQRLWYLHREITWGEFKVESIEDDGLYLTLYGKDQKSCPWPDTYLDFPNRLFSNDEQKKAALSHMGCSEAILWMLEFKQALLEDVVANTELIVLMPMNNKREVKEAHTGATTIFDLSDSFHEILLITLRSGEKFAVDMSGAQYGYSKPVSHLGEYQRDRTRIVIETRPLPKPLGLLRTLDDVTTAQAFVDEIKKLLKDELKQGKMLQPYREILGVMNVEIMKWNAMAKDDPTYINFMDIFKLPGKEFLIQVIKLMDYVEWKLSSRGKQWSTAHGLRLIEKYKEKSESDSGDS